MKKPRVLFVVESITTAQVVRLLLLARSLPRSRYEVVFASGDPDSSLFDGADLDVRPIHTLPSAKIFDALEAGKRPYEKADLAGYVEADLALLGEVRPDLVVGDFRLSLTVSARVAGAPLATLINAYWSPHAVRDRFPIPDHPIIDLVGLELATKYFPLALPRVLRHFAAPVNALRKRYGLRPLGDLLSVLTDGELVLYPDVPELVPTRELPAHHVYLGPLCWSAPAPMPVILERARDRPLVYVTLGSSGKIDRLPMVLDALGDLAIDVVAATANRIELPHVPPNVHLAALVPGDRLCREASVVVCNGGSTTGYQALLEGKPVVGIASNLDQFLAMDAIEALGAGRMLRSASLRREQVAEAVRAVLGAREYHLAASRARLALRRADAIERFGALLDRFFAGGGASAVSRATAR